MSAIHPPPPQLRVAFVGCGNIARYHATAALATGRVAITALVDPNPSARAAILALLPKKQGEESSPTRSASAAVEEFDSLSDAVARDPDRSLFDAVDIMVPSYHVDGEDLHERLAMASLAAGRHVLLEKPVCTDPEAAMRLDDFHRTRAPDLVLAVGENAQFWPEILEARRCVERGEIGELLSVRAKLWESATGEWADGYREGSWRCDESRLPAASFTYDSSTHFVRALRMLTDSEVVRVAGVTGKALPHMAGPSMSQHVLVFGNSMSATFESMLAPRGISDQPFFTLQGTKGEIVIHGYKGGCYRHTLDEDGTPVVKELCKIGWDAGYAGEYDDFAAAVLDGKPTAGPVKEALADLRIIRALLRSAEEGVWVET